MHDVSTVDVIGRDEVNVLREQLLRQYPQAAPRTIDIALQVATSRVATRASAPGRAPDLVAREARAWLGHRLAPPARN